MIARPKPLRVLPCVDSSDRPHPIDILRSTPELDMLSAAPVSALVYRALSDAPDAIVIVTKDLGSIARRDAQDLTETLSLTPTVLLASQINELLRKRAAALHIRSVVPLDVTSNQLVAAIHATVAGLAVTLVPFGQIEDENTAWTRADGIGEAERVVEHLTARETLVLGLIARGFGNKQIAVRLAISEHTAKFHVSSILAKLGVTSRTEAVTIGIMRGLVAI